jgi:APA family basic amino acid/polyamine antiporter
MDQAQQQNQRQGLRRALGTPLLTLYGLGVIIGAGIYVLIGSVIDAAGGVAPWSFVLAGLLAGLTGLSYAELAVRYPEAAGAAAYVKEAFRSDRLAQLVGLAVALVVITSTASIARGSVGYLQEFVDWPTIVIAGGMVVIFTVIACFGVRESIGFAALMTLIELGGLLLVLAAGWPDPGAIAERAHEIVPAAELKVWAGIAGGAFLAFFAFIGFENLANMAEEARAPERSLPRALLLSLAISTALYAAVAVVTVLAAPLAELAGSAAPLMLVAERASWFSADVFAAIALIAVANGVLIELVTLARLLYGMARRGWLPDTLGTVHPSTQTPVKATLCGGLIVFVLAVVLPFLSLVSLTNSITLLVFAMVNAALWRLQQVAPRQSGFRVPRAIPPLAIILTLALAGAQWVQ